MAIPEAMNRNELGHSIEAACLEFEQEPMDDYYKKRIVGYPSRLRVSRIIRELGDIRGKKILDAGCEAGYVSLRLHEKGAVVIPFDICLPAIRDFQKKLGSRNIGSIKPLYALAHSIPLRDNSVDGIVCTEVIEHMPDLDAVFGEFRRVLRPGGKIVVTFPNERLRKLLYPIARLAGVNTDVEKDVTLFSYSLSDIKSRLGRHFRISGAYSLPWYFPVTRLVVCRK